MSDEDNKSKGAEILPFKPRPKEEVKEVDEKEPVVGAYQCSCGSPSLTLYTDGLVQCSECLMYASNLIVMEGEIEIDFTPDEDPEGDDDE